MGRKARVVTDEELAGRRDTLNRWYTETESLCGWMVAQFGVWRARRAGIERDDLLQAARMGLWRAALRYDPSTGIKLKTYAQQFIRGAMMDAIEAARYGRKMRGEPLYDHSAFAPLTDHPVTPPENMDLECCDVCGVRAHLTLMETAIPPIWVCEDCCDWIAERG